MPRFKIKPHEWKWQLGRDPKGKAAKPWRNQSAAFKAMCGMRQVALWVDMGLGKTKIIINWAEWLRANDKIDVCFIYGPRDLGETWMEQLEECVGPDAIHQGGRRINNPNTYINIVEKDDKAARLKQIAKAIGDGIFYIYINYEGSVGLKQEMLTLAGDHRFLFVADESTKIKNAQKQRTKATKKLAFHAAYIALLSGAPTPQGPQDAFGQYWVLDDKIFGQYFTTFRYEYLVTNIYNGIVGLKPTMRKEFYTKFNAPAIIQKKKDWSDIPPKVYETLHYDLSPAERKIYKKMSEEWEVLIKRKKITAENALVAALRLAQVCTGFAGSFNKELETVDVRIDKCTKLNLLAEVIEERIDPDGKFVIWCAWQENIRRVCEMLKKKGIVYVDYYGKTKDPRKNELAFRKDKAVRAFVGTQAKGSMGLNLQGPNTRTEIYYSQGHSAEQRQQSEDRIHRGTIKHNVTVIDLVARKTVEPSILKGLQKKWNWQNVLLTDPRGFIYGAKK